jgi:hypothetical protein
MGTGNVPRTARTGSHTVNGVVHGARYGGVLPHTQIVIAAPDQNIAPGFTAGSHGELPRFAFHIQKHAVTPFLFQRIHGALKAGLVGAAIPAGMVILQGKGGGFWHYVVLKRVIEWIFLNIYS